MADYFFFSEDGGQEIGKNVAVCATIQPDFFAYAPKMLHKVQHFTSTGRSTAQILHKMQHFCDKIYLLIGRTLLYYIQVEAT
ncbi:hypothetical protein MKZ15_01105 [Paenibacillus sp. FSL R7-0216]|uniref:hypothetical protein n=1 Tax=Paenibacillus sp. FSL R7-0216 TaxID=2921677 RepID=UPI0030DD2669